jgi:hypothetical protein
VGDHELRYQSQSNRRQIDEYAEILTANRSMIRKADDDPSPTEAHVSAQAREISGR